MRGNLLISINENLPDWKARLVRDYPICIFCGGTRPSAEPDHQPARTFFRERKSPEGYAFPACVKCNRYSRGEEVFASLLATIRRPDDTGDAKTDSSVGAEIQRKLRGIERNQRGILRRMVPSSNQIRRAARMMGLEKQPGQFWRDLWHETKVVRIDHPEFHSAVLSVARKLFLALHWKHTDGTIISPSGGVLVDYFSNYEIQQGEEPIPSLARAAALCEFSPTLSRAGIDLSDQFFYRTTHVTMDRGIYFAFFPESLVIVGEVFESRETVPRELLKQFIGPIHHEAD